MNEKDTRDIKVITAMLSIIFTCPIRAGNWLEAENPAFGGLSALEMVAEGESDRVLKYLTSMASSGGW